MEFCLWCNQPIMDAREVSGSVDADWATIDREGRPFDFGCDNSPETTEEAAGDHLSVSEVRRLMAAGVEPVVDTDEVDALIRDRRG